MQRNDSKEKADSFIQKFRDHGLKVTPQRTAIYHELLKAKDHPTIEVILKKVRTALPSISFDTVYRTVLSFADYGIIQIVGGYGGSKRFDADISQHHHFRCVRCEKIEDFRSDYFDNIKIPDEVKKQFNVSQKKVLLEGICAECSKKK
ncbi:MAG: Fur family transcriptional regulator [Candidatus Omnitrophica bacterium]|nr:Fur family transcriptional regulator [Candidatus Omnitrophota bacterium]